MINITDEAQASTDGYRKDKRVNGIEQMVDIIRTVAEEELELLTATGITSADLLNDTDPYKFRRRDTRFTTGGIVGHMSEHLFWHAVRYAIFDAKKALAGQQPDAIWVMCAWEVTSRVVHKRRRTAMNDADFASVRGKWNRFDGESTPQRHLMKLEEDPVIVFRFAFVDYTQGKEQDMWRERTGLPTSPMTRFTETGDYKVLPPSLRKERDDALDLLKRFVDHNSAEKPEVFMTVTGDDPDHEAWPEKPDPLPQLPELRDLADRYGVDISDLGKKRTEMYNRVREAVLSG